MNIGIDIGGTNIGAGLIDEKLNFIYKIEIPTEAQKGYHFVEEKLIKAIKDMSALAAEMGEGIDSIGIGIPGLADKEGGNIIYCPNLGWRDIPIRANLKKRFDTEINIENDASLAGIAENVLGISKGYKNSIFITLGTGVGSGIILDGKLYKGSHGVGSELGHLIVGENFYDCNCGKNGCLETFASSTAIEKYVLKEIKEGNGETRLLDLVDKLEDIDTKLIFSCAQEGDALSIDAVNRMIKYLSIGITNIINIMDPEIIVIGGGISRAGDFLLDSLNKALQKYLLFEEMGYADIKLAKLGNDAGIIGAAILSQYK